LQSPQLVLGLFPEWFALPQTDWPPNVHLTGFVMDESQSAPPTPDLDKFLGCGPVALFTAGSEAKLEGFFRESVEVARLAGVKALFVGKHRMPVFDQLPAHVQHAAWVPFQEVLSRCAAVVHHGGIGTFAHAVKAGVPQLVVPHAHDQPDHALRVERLGLGRSLYPEKYRGVRAAAMLKELIESKVIRNRCSEFRAQMDGTRALAKACSLLESLGVAAVSADTPQRVSERAGDDALGHRQDEQTV